MACRCEDISLYEEDIKNLEEAATHAQKIIDYQISIDDSVDTLKCSYGESIYGPDDLPSAFDDIHEGAIDNARAIKAQMEGAILTAKNKLAAAREEDEAFHEQG